MLRALFALALSLVLAATAVHSQDLDGASAARPRMVKTWVPPYAIAPSWEQLNKTYGGAGPRNALTHLGLQFWVPTASGGVERSSRYGAISNAQIRQLVRWGQRNGVKILLTVYNGEWGWDWPLASNAFGANRAGFIRDLLREMRKHDLDGIDIDLEGAGITPTEQEKDEYVAFIRVLGKALHAEGKHLVLDSFSYVWNAPNTDWWPALFPHVDGIVSMGYAQIGRDPPAGSGEWQAYAWQKAAAGKFADRLLLGTPSDVDAWQGNTALEQIIWAAPRSARVGIGIWDAQNQAPAWQSAPVWKQLKRMRDQN